MIWKNITMSDFYCTKCGGKIYPIWRKVGREKEPGHLKKLFCLNCQEEVNCCEIKPFSTKYALEDFITEWEYDNFDEEGNRKITYGELKTLINNEKISKVKDYNERGEKI